MLYLIKELLFDPTKTNSIEQWPIPQNFTELRGFLGLTGYYRKFVQSYGIISKPLTSLLKMKKINWTPAAQQAFHTLKTALVSTPVLALPNIKAPFEIDTMHVALGFEFCCHKKAIQLLTSARLLSVNNHKLSTYEKEFLALLMAVDKWRPYLLKKLFIIKTESKSSTRSNIIHWNAKEGHGQAGRTEL